MVRTSMQCSPPDCLPRIHLFLQIQLSCCGHLLLTRAKSVDGPVPICDNLELEVRRPDFQKIPPGRKVAAPTSLLVILLGPRPRTASPPSPPG